MTGWGKKDGCMGGYFKVTSKSVKGSWNDNR